MKTLTIAYITTREKPQLRWFLESIEKQITNGEDVRIILVSPLWTDYDAASLLETAKFAGCDFKHVRPKPNVWQGEHRVTPVDWWAKSNAINTALCLCKTEWIMFIDDRCVLMPGFMTAVRDAMAGNYIMAGAYEKRHSMTVENGIIKHGGIITGSDGRTGSLAGPVDCTGHWLFGCCTLAPLEWWLQINGAPEKCDSLSFEDVIIGMLFQNNGFPIKYDVRAKMIEDRTVSEIGEPMSRSSKEKHPHDASDKAHTLLRWVNAGAKRSENGFEIRELRDAIQKGELFPIPDPEVIYKDWFDGQPLSEMV
jgi:hypothetical protein